MENKVVLITGGALGIGKRTAVYLAEKGYHIVINYRNSRREAEHLVERLRELSGLEHVSVQGDVANFADCKNIVDTAVRAFGKIDILIHNAGPYIRERKPAIEYSVEEWDYLIRGNLNSAFYLVKLILPYMRKQRWGRIVTFGYDRVETAPGWIYRSAFAAAKTGLASFTRTIALEEAENGITANMVSPGDIKNEWKEKSIEDALRAGQQTEQGVREGTGEDIARLIAFLVDERSDFITGSIFSATGGVDVLGKVFRNQIKNE